MVRGLGWKLWKPSFLVLLIAGFTAPHPAKAQGFVNAVPARARVFAGINSAVVTMKRDSAGHYYVLAAPPNVIWVLDSDGKRIGRIPRAETETSKIQYAADFDVDSDGRVLVADRAANAVEIFSTDGVFVTKVSVFAPTGVVGLPDHQFAVSTLRGKRLVEIRSDDGSLVRSFGDLAEAGGDSQSNQLQNLGKVFGDGAGDIYYAFAARQDPTVRKYDRFGYAANDVTYDLSLYGKDLPPVPNDRVQFGVNYSQTSLSDSYNTWAAVGNKGDFFFGGGLSPGLGARIGEGPQTAQSATANLLSTGMATGPGGGGPGGAAGGGMVTAQGVIAPDSKQFHLGGKHAGNQNSSSVTDEKSESSSIGASDLQFSAQSSGSSDSSGSGDSSATNSSSATNNSDISLAELFSTTPVSGLGGGSAVVSGRGMGGMFGGVGVGQGFFPGFGGFGQFGDGSFPQRSQSSFASTASSAPTSGGMGDSHGFTRGPGDSHFGGGHGRYGEGIYNLTGTVKVNLDHIIDTSKDKPAITAVGVDPVTQDVWAAIGRTLAHFDKNGNYLGDYFIATPEGAFLHASAIIVEPDRLIVASDRGVYEFARSGGPAHSAAPPPIVAPKGKPQASRQQ
jgi:hypothetical protein